MEFTGTGNSRRRRRTCQQSRSRLALDLGGSPRTHGLRSSFNPDLSSSSFKPPRLVRPWRNLPQRTRCQYFSAAGFGRMLNAPERALERVVIRL
jgi:hypothetical protein